MKRLTAIQFRSCRRRSPVASRPNQGFTLTEVLVVLAIMVILFGMLFIPITSSLEMVSTARHRSQMNQTMRLAMEQIRRELSDAVAIYLPEYLPLSSGPDATYLINYSNVTFIPAARDLVTGQVLMPLQGVAHVVRYMVHTPQSTRNPQTVVADGVHYLVEQPTTVDNPFVLYRQEGYMSELIPGRNLFGSDYDEDGDGTADYFLVGWPRSENALTPVRDADIPVTETIFLDDNRIVLGSKEGYVEPGDAGDGDFFGGSGERLVYIHGGIQFTPLRVEGERMRIGANNTVYTARYGNWLGQQDDGTHSLSALPLINSSELRPRFVVERGGSVILDTDPMDPVALLDDIRYDSQAGTASVWLLYPDPAIAQAVFDLTTAPIPPNPGNPWTVGYSPSGAISGTDYEYTKPKTRAEPLTDTAWQTTKWLPMTNTGTFTDGEDVTIDPGGVAEDLGAITAIVDGVGLWVTNSLSANYGPGTLVQANEKSAKTPSTYTITPQPALSPADKIIVPDSVRVWVEAWDEDTSRRYALEYTRVQVADANDLRAGQFWLEPTAANNYTTAKVHFANSSGAYPPPSPEVPATYGAPSGFDWHDLTTNAKDYFLIVVQYQYRRNFEPGVGANYRSADQIIVSYSTKEVYNIALEVMPYRYLDETAPDSKIWRPHGPATGVQMRGHVAVRNLSR